ncbi:MAG: hypothetical protein KDC48_06695 [Planctomycetes bacterium]|nr:hypothetical protein [Planctomycetota bacterium]
MNNRLPIVVLCCLGWLVPAFQGQEPKPAPAKPASESPAAQPKEGAKEVGKGDAKEGAKGAPQDAAPAARHAFEGVYELRRRMVAGTIDPRTGTGYCAITSRHLFLTMLGPGVNPSRPLLRADVRGWKPVDNGMQTEIKLSYFNDADGNVLVQRPGERAVRRVDIARGLLRIYQDDASYLEFERIE